MDDRVRADVACLVDSPYRGPLLLGLEDGPARREQLRETVDASRATVSRALSAFEEREWVWRDGRAYRLTSLGRLVASAFERLDATMTAANDLRGVIEHLPLEEMGFGVERLRDARVVRPSRADPFATMRYADRFVETGDSVAMLSHAFSPGVLEAVQERAAADRPTWMVVTVDVIERVAAEADLRGPVRESLASEAVGLWQSEQPVAYAFAIADDTVSFAVTDDDGRPIAVVDTSDRRVLEWARSTFEAYRDRATELGPDRFA
jgi:predicted transcriptional regulator